MIITIKNDADPGNLQIKLQSNPKYRFMVICYFNDTWKSTNFDLWPHIWRSRLSLRGPILFSVSFWYNSVHFDTKIIHITFFVAKIQFLVIKARVIDLWPPEKNFPQPQSHLTFFWSILTPIPTKISWNLLLLNFFTDWLKIWLKLGY